MFKPYLEMTMRTLMRNYRSQIMLAILSALMLTLAFPKADQGWLAWIALVPWLLALRQLGFKSGFLLGFGFGMAHHLGLVYWTVHTMHHYGHLPMVQAVMVLILFSGYLSVFTALFSGIAAWLIRKPLHLVVLAPALWICLEMLRTWLFTGFPWALLGYSQYKYLWIIQVADLFGVYGLSGLVVCSNVVFTLVILSWLELDWHDVVLSKKISIRCVAAFAMIMAAVLVYGGLRTRAIDKIASTSDPVEVAVIQGNIDQAHKWDPRFQMLTTVKYRNLSLNSSVQDADLVIWPETATPFYFLDDRVLTGMVVEGIKTAKAHFVIGSPSYAAGKESLIYHNSAYLVSPEGQVEGKYDKVHLVPFGEYVPLKRWLPFINKMVAQVGDFKPGHEGNTLAWEGHRIGMLICYEVIFPGLARAMAQNGAHLLVNITNDAWFGRTSAAFQHFSMAVFRAVENRRHLARAANTGISGFIDPCGRIVALTQLYQEATVKYRISLLEVSSLYNRWGEWPLGIIVFATLSIYIGRHFFSRNRA
ncbi:MAG: apolipoprotein N-acyltransferase [Desulfobacteraceae bacterium]